MRHTALKNGRQFLAIQLQSLCIILTCRGTEFRTEFSKISEVRSLIPCTANLMALTATATAKTRQMIVSSLDMKGCHFVVRVPNKPNIKYFVCSPDSAEEMLCPIVEDICMRNVQADRAIIFC